MTDWTAKPYIAPNTLHCVDAFELLAALPDASVDLILTDPPYGLAGRVFSVESKKYEAVNEDWDYDVPLEWLNEVERVLKPTGSLVCFCVRKGTYQIASNCLTRGWRLVNDITWLKPNAPPCFTGRNMTETTERALWFSPSGKNWIYNLDIAKENNNGMNFRDVITFYAPIKRQHPTQKPLELFKLLIELLTLPDGLVVDCFLGSGTTAVAAHITGRRFICGDQSPEYIEIARRRVFPEFGKPPQRAKEIKPLTDLPLFEGLTAV